MLAYFPLQDKIVNTKTITFVAVVGRTDEYHGDHVIIKFVDGTFMEFPPEVSLHEVYTTLTEGSPYG